MRRAQSASAATRKQKGGTTKEEPKVPLAKLLTGGYAQPDVAMDSHVDGSAFAKIPEIYPSPLKAAGQTVMLVSWNIVVTTSAATSPAISLRA